MRLWILFLFALLLPSFVIADSICLASPPIEIFSEMTYSISACGVVPEDNSFTFIPAQCSGLNPHLCEVCSDRDIFRVQNATLRIPMDSGEQYCQVIIESFGSPTGVDFGLTSTNQFDQRTFSELSLLKQDTRSVICTEGSNNIIRSYYAGPVTFDGGTVFIDDETQVPVDLLRVRGDIGIQSISVICQDEIPTGDIDHIISFDRDFYRLSAPIIATVNLEKTVNSQIDPFGDIIYDLIFENITANQISASSCVPSNQGSNVRLRCNLTHDQRSEINFRLEINKLGNISYRSVITYDTVSGLKVDEQSGIISIQEEVSQDLDTVVSGRAVTFITTEHQRKEIRELEYLDRIQRMEMICAGTIVTGSIYDINTCQDLQNINDDLHGTYVLQRDIDCLNFNFDSIKRTFSGKLYGNGFVIKNLNVNGPGLFSQVGGNVVIDNVHISGSTLSTSHSVGGFIGSVRAGSVFIRNSSFTGNISSTSHGVGGLIGNSDKFSSIHIESSFVVGNISGLHGVGGLIGNSNNLNLSRSYFKGSVSASSHSVGGLVGRGDGIILNSYAIASVYAGSHGPGGIVGYILSGNNVSLINSYFSGSVFIRNSSFTGNILGPTSMNIINSYWDSDACPTCSLNSNARTSFELKQISTFSNWNITSNDNTMNYIWYIEDTVSYPVLLLNQDASFTPQIDVFEEFVSSAEIIIRNHNTRESYKYVSNLRIGNTFFFDLTNPMREQFLGTPYPLTIRSGLYTVEAFCGDTSCYNPYPEIRPTEFRDWTKLLLPGRTFLSFHNQNNIPDTVCDSSRILRPIQLFNQTNPIEVQPIQP